MSMSDQYDDEEQPEPQKGPRELRAQIDALNAENARLKEVAERTAQLEAENGLFKANLGTLSEAQQKAVLATADQMTAEALRSQAELLGFIEPPAPAAPPADIAAHDKIAQVVAGGDGGGPNPANYDAEVSAANSPDELRAIMAKYGRTPEIVD